MQGLVYEGFARTAKKWLRPQIQSRIHIRRLWGRSLPLLGADSALRTRRAIHGLLAQPSMRVTSVRFRLPRCDKE